MSNTFPVFNCN
ncbi:hypothetical protein EEL30_00555 (plasmid) [Brevibacillus laterosporus]|uniref:Uncharacterized protein n=1 Tax=Brevibacillus laterosporus TaxID=1465 RepID=A0A518V230_BRELA|nr:hypothetical protein EEL30_00555 [Brevibacillus laterosporus]